MFNPFDIFNLPIGLQIDKNQLEKKFYELMKCYYSKQLPPALQEITDVDINLAYKVLKSLDLRIKYILETNAIDISEKAALPPNFLMDMMDLNEGIEEALHHSETEKKNNIKNDIENKMEDIQLPLKTLCLQATLPLNQDTLHILKNYYIQMSYLTKLTKRLS